MKINENIKNFLVGGSLVSFASYFLNKLNSKNTPKIMAILLHGAPIVFVSTLITINNVKVRNNLIKSGLHSIEKNSSNGYRSANWYDQNFITKDFLNTSK